MLNGMSAISVSKVFYIQLSRMNHHGSANEEEEQPQHENAPFESGKTSHTSKANELMRNKTLGLRGAPRAAVW